MSGGRPEAAREIEHMPTQIRNIDVELFLKLEGQGEVRLGDERHPVRAGDLIACPPGGPETAHQIINSSDGELRYLAVSTTSSPEVAQYPDSDKCGVVFFEGTQDNGLPKMWRLMMHMSDTDVDYWDGEE